MSTLLMITIMTAAGMLRSVQQDLVQLCAVVGLRNYEVFFTILELFFVLLCTTVFNIPLHVSCSKLLLVILQIEGAVHSCYLVALLSDN